MKNQRVFINIITELFFKRHLNLIGIFFITYIRDPHSNHNRFDIALFQ